MALHRFSIRDLLWLTLVVAVAIGWWVDRQALVEARRISDAIWVEAVVKAEMERDELKHGPRP